MITPEQLDACAGTALLYMGPDGAADDFVVRLRHAMDAGDRDEAEHLSACMLGLMFKRVSLDSMMIAAEIWHEAFVVGGQASKEELGHGTQVLPQRGQ